jgi:hypothetical protein
MHLSAQVVRSMAAALPTLAAEGQWVPLRRATQFLLWLTHHAPGSASMFIAAKGTVRIQGAARLPDCAVIAAACARSQCGRVVVVSSFAHFCWACTALAPLCACGWKAAAQAQGGG